MKAVLQAGWLLTVAIGNFIVLIVAEIAKLPKQVKKSAPTSQSHISETKKDRSVCDRDACCVNNMFVSLLSKWAEYVLFASLLLVVCVIFSIMAHFYTYIDPAEIEAQFNKEESDDDEDDKSQLQRMELEMTKKTKI